jgi:hypothetical protein
MEIHWHKGPITTKCDEGLLWNAWRGEEEPAGLKVPTEDEAGTVEGLMAAVVMDHHLTDEVDMVVVLRMEEALMVLPAAADMHQGRMGGERMVHVEVTAAVRGVGEHHRHRATPVGLGLTIGGHLLPRPTEVTGPAGKHLQRLLELHMLTIPPCLVYLRAS